MHIRITSQFHLFLKNSSYFWGYIHPWKHENPISDCILRKEWSSPLQWSISNSSSVRGIIWRSFHLSVLKFCLAWPCAGHPGCSEFWSAIAKVCPGDSIPPHLQALTSYLLLFGNVPQNSRNDGAESSRGSRIWYSTILVWFLLLW